MKLNEVTNLLKTYSATVRIVLRNGSTTARTTITADTLSHARAMLTRIYGENNVLNISETFSESGRTQQVNAKASFTDQRKLRLLRGEKSAPAEFSCVSETENTTRVLSPAELQVKSLSDKAKQINQQAKQVKARHSLEKAQERLRKAGAGSALSR